MIDTARWQRITGEGFAPIAVGGGIASVIAFLAFVMYLYARAPS